MLLTGDAVDMQHVLDAEAHVHFPRPLVFNLFFKRPPRPLAQAVLLAQLVTERGPGSPQLRARTEDVITGYVQLPAELLPALDGPEWSRRVYGKFCEMFV